MKLATWNVNSVRSRLERLLAWIEKYPVDILCLQEIKCRDEDFPTQAITDAGYHQYVFGQKTYNGVAILSKTPPQHVRRGFDDGIDDGQSRFIEAEIGSLRVLNAYFPSGSQVGSDKYAYKLEWMRRLGVYLEKHHRPDEPLVLAGDFNVAMSDKDVCVPDLWSDSVLCCPDVRAALEKIHRWGFTDVFEKHHPNGGIYSWWDYRRLAFPKNDGLRIDHIFATESTAAKCTAAEIDRDERKGKHASDHAPLIATFEGK